MSCDRTPLFCIPVARRIDDDWNNPSCFERRRRAAGEEWARATSNARGTSLDWRTAVFAAGRVGPKAPPARTRTPAARSDLPPGPGGDARPRPRLWRPLVDQSDGWVSPLASAPGPGRLKGRRHAHCRGVAQAGGWGGNKKTAETPAGSRGTSGGGGSPTATTPSNSAPRPRPLTTRAWRVRVRVTAVTVPGGLRAGWPEPGGVGGGRP